MPYIPQNDRVHLDKYIKELVAIINTSSKKEGMTNYIITRLIMGGLFPVCYADYNGAIGVLECCKMELYRRKVALYENKAMVDNGDIPEF